MLGENPERLEAIIYNDDNLTYNDDNLTYENIVSVSVGADEIVAALTDGGIKELRDMIRDARITIKTWPEYLDDFEDNGELVARIKAQPLR